MIFPLYIKSFLVAITLLRNNHRIRKTNEYKILNKSTDISVEVLEPGLVIIRNFLPEDEQKRMAKCALKCGSDNERGFFETDTRTGEMKLNADERRGRIYDAITRFPNWINDNARAACEVARKVDSSMPKMCCTHLLLNMYTSSNGLVWHRDIYENDGQSDHPVINICIGASCRFGLRHHDEPGIKGDTEREIILRSGDVLIFGGKCRYIKHAVLDVILDDSPEWMEVPCRFSFTFRDSPEVLGREDEFRYFKVKDHLVGQDNFKQLPTNMKKFTGIPAQKSQKERRAFVHEL